MLFVSLTVLYTLLIWWISTGVILYLDRLAPSTYRKSMLAITALLLPALAGLAATSEGTGGPWDALIAFSCALIVWGWHEMSFLMGHITGPRTTACPPGSTGWTRFTQAAQTVLYHEIAIVATIAAVAALTAGGGNQVGVATLALLWIMRLSTKFNLFLGVPRHYEELLPAHLAFLKTYFKTKQMNWLFPLSVTGTTLLTAYLLQNAALAEASSLERTGYLLLGSLAALALAEHWFMVAPIPNEIIWGWAQPGAATKTKTEPDRRTPPAAAGIDAESNSQGRRFAVGPA